MASRRKRTTLEPAARVRHLIALDAAGVMKRIRTRHREMVVLFSRLRDREPLLETVRSWFGTISFAELAMLEPAEQRAVSLFYDGLGEVRWYLQYTQDMPLQVHHRVGEFVKELEASHRRLVEAIGPPGADGARIVDAEVVPEGRDAALVHAASGRGRRKAGRQQRGPAGRAGME